MSEKKVRHRHKKSDGKSFIILPIIFLVGIYLILYLAFAPTIDTIGNAMGLFFSNTEKDYSTEYENIFVPVAEDSTADTVDKNVNISDIEFPKYGNQFGELIIEDCDVDVKLFFGDGEVSLRNGVGVYNGSFIPGYGRPILVAGHNNTYFNGLKNAKVGQTVKIRTSYGNYQYRITGKDVKYFNDKTAYDLTADKETLTMYTCYPFDELGLTDFRCFVYAEYVSGPQIDKNAQEGN